MSKAGLRRRPAMELHIFGLGDGEQQFSFNVGCHEIGLNESFPGNVTVEGTIRKVSKQILVTATVRAHSIRECDRCLIAVGTDLALPLHLVYGPNLGEASSLDESDAIEIRTLTLEQDSIVLDDEVRDTLFLYTPMKTLCSEGCLGICPSCGADLNRESCRCDHSETDPRWAKLADVFRKKEEEE